MFVARAGQGLSLLPTWSKSSEQSIAGSLNQQPAKRANIDCMKRSSALADWTPEQLALGKRWVETWKLAAVDLERIKRKEIRELDTYKTISLLCGTADYTKPPYAPKPWSGLIEQQRWFKKAARRE